MEKNSPPKEKTNPSSQRVEAIPQPRPVTKVEEAASTTEIKPDEIEEPTVDELSEVERKELEYWENYFKTKDETPAFEPSELAFAIRRGCGCHDFSKDKELIQKEAEKHLSYINNELMPYSEGWKDSEDGKTVITYLEKYIASKGLSEESNPKKEEATTEELLIRNKCASCHMWANSLNGIKSNANSSVTQLSQKLMPPDDTDWIGTEDGNIVLEWLKSL